MAVWSRLPKFSCALRSDRSSRSAFPASQRSARSLCILPRELLGQIACPGDDHQDREGARLFTHRKLFLSGGSDSRRCFFGDFLCTSKESYPLAVGQRKLLLMNLKKKKKKKNQRKNWIPAFAGMTSEGRISRFRRNDDQIARSANKRARVNCRQPASRRSPPPEAVTCRSRAAGRLRHCSRVQKYTRRACGPAARC